jgi:hypothetical protein
VLAHRDSSALRDGRIRGSTKGITADTVGESSGLVSNSTRLRPSSRTGRAGVREHADRVRGASSRPGRSTSHGKGLACQSIRSFGKVSTICDARTLTVFAWRAPVRTSQIRCLVCDIFNASNGVRSLIFGGWRS